MYVDDDAMNRLRVLDRKHSLLFCFSHRSYLDGTLVPEVVGSRGMMPAFTFGGANLNFFPMGALASRSGIDLHPPRHQRHPVYRMALRAYIAQLIRNRQNLAWSIEGGRTRTGKLRPPGFGILRYVTDALRAADSSDALVVPVSIVYDQLHEVSKMTTEARGGRKSPEDLRWLVGFAREQRQRLGRAYVDFGEPLPLRERLSELHADEAAARHSVERIAVEICHRINRATPVTATAVVSVAMLGARPSALARRGARDGRPVGRLPRGARVAGGRRARPHRPVDDPPHPAGAGRLRHPHVVRRRGGAGLADRRRPAPRGRVLPQHRDPRLRRAGDRRGRTDGGRRERLATSGRSPPTRRCGCASC